RSAQIKVKDKTVNVVQQGRSSAQQDQTATQTTQPSAKTDPASAQMSVGSPTASSTSAKKASSGGAAGCSFALSKASQNIGAKDGKGSFSVKTDNGCEWKAVPNAGWISIASGSSGKGKGMVKFTVQENRESTPRTGQINVAGQTFSVNQKGQKTGNKERKHR
ncbi:MAG TPA: BACON domain-containing protein, partial [Syntrophorhabdaceae bacterium]|nr:BACON domain-containing protein [Syntrophorhabdaceae bacterium]